MLAGALLIDKPSGITSNSALKVVKKMPELEGHKAGHVGTLDPFATGLLMVLIGFATSFQRGVQQLDKHYVTEVQFGATSNTGDTEGEIETSGSTVAREQIDSELASFVGELKQQVPIFSAVKVDGERLYKKARRGETSETVDMPVRVVKIDSIEILNFNEDKQTATLDIKCGKGTYIRQLVADIGEQIGVGAFCLGLRRLSIGPFTVEDAITLDRLDRLTGPRELSGFKPLKCFFGETEISEVIT